MNMNSLPVQHHLKNGFDDPARGSQQTFRSILDAMENPGQLITIRQDPFAPKVFNSASAATCLTLLDDETPVWTDVDWKSPAISWLQFGCGSSVVTEPSMANFAIITRPDNMPALNFFRISRYEQPEKATTIIVQVSDILPRAENTQPKNLAGKAASLELIGVPETFWHQWRQLSSLHPLPLGIDIFFTCDDVLTSLPRTRRLLN
jgi:alpha-D-ribose 1-methylphosphonate 5-triphosphate synthase subunit PhnH